MSNFVRLRLNKPIALVGIMGVGKTTIGLRLANKLNLPFWDTDKLIQEEVGCSIDEVFKYMGEDYFRKKEREIIAKVIDSQPCIISLGDGGFVDPESQKLIKQRAISIWLRADYDTILERVSRRNTRPVLEKGNKAEILKNLIDKRYPIYEAADHCIDSGDGSHMNIVNAILDILKEEL